MLKRYEGEYDWVYDICSIYQNAEDVVKYSMQHFEQQALIGPGLVGDICVLSCPPDYSGDMDSKNSTVIDNIVSLEEFAREHQVTNVNGKSLTTVLEEFHIKSIELIKKRNNKEEEKILVMSRILT